MARTNFLHKADKPENEPFLSLKFIEETLASFDQWILTLEFILRTMNSFCIKSDNSITEIDEKNQFGQSGEYKLFIPGVAPYKNKVPILIKRLNHHEYTYEIRIDSSEYHHRLLFFTAELKKVEIQNAPLFYIVTFGFTKTINNASSDRTDELASSSDYIKKDLESNNNCLEAYQKWLGDDLNV